MTRTDTPLIPDLDAARERFWGGTVSLEDAAAALHTTPLGLYMKHHRGTAPVDFVKRGHAWHVSTVSLRREVRRRAEILATRRERLAA